MTNQDPFDGYWSLLCDSETKSSVCSTGIRTVSGKLRKLPEMFPELFPIPPKAKKLKGTDIDNLLVFTAGHSDEDVEKSAEAIRSVVAFPFVMNYFTRHADPKDSRWRYEHTPDGELFKKCDRGNSAGSAINLIGKKAALKATFDELLPSQVVDRDYIHLPADEEDFKKVTGEKGGKWMVHCSDLDTLDNLWKNLTRLYATGVIVGLKSCTLQFSIATICSGYNTKAIFCYTSDAECKLSVKRAAESIYICTGYSYPMFYKSNAASLAGKYRHEGFSRVCKYMYTSGREILEKDYLGRWKKIVFDEEKCK